MDQNATFGACVTVIYAILLLTFVPFASFNCEFQLYAINMDIKHKTLCRDAFTFCESLLHEQEMFAEGSAAIGDAAQYLGEKMYLAVLQVIEDNTQEDVEALYLSDEPEVAEEQEDNEEWDDNSGAHEGKEKIKDPDFNDKELEAGRDCQKVSLEEMEAAVAMRAAYPKRSIKGLKRLKGMAKVKDMRTLTNWASYVTNGGTQGYKLEKLAENVYEQFVIARQALKPITYHDLRSWAIHEAQKFGLDTFGASQSWMDSFKTKNRIRQRRTARFVSCKEVATHEEIMRSAGVFKNQLAVLVPQFEPRFVLNTDQTGCEFQIMTNRTYSHRGERVTLVSTKNPNKCTHSYTAQYTVSLDGRLLPKVFLCMKESNDEFGPIVKVRVEKLVEEYQNVYVTSSKSGKLTTKLYKDYLVDVLKPYVKDNQFLFVCDSWTGQTNMDMYDQIFVDDNNLPTCTVKVIPGKCTSMCQPLDVYFYRQVKLLIKRIQSNVVLFKEKREINSREDCIKVHSIILHQLGAAVFQDMIRYAWFACGAGGEKPDFKNVKEVCFPKETYAALCSCKKNAFIRCSVCKLYLCFHCFFDEYHPKNCIGEQ